jgi:hypothetical protein
MNSYTRSNDKPNPDCQVCSDDSQTIILCNIKDFGEFTLKDLTEKVLLGSPCTDLDSSMLAIEFNSKIIYEYDK